MFLNSLIGKKFHFWEITSKMINFFNVRKNLLIAALG